MTINSLMSCSSRASRRDLDSTPLRPLRLRNADSQNAIVELGLHLLVIDAFRQHDAVGKPADAARLAAHDSLPFLLLDLAADHELIADLLDVDILALDTRNLHLEHIRIVLLLDVDE